MSSHNWLYHQLRGWCIAAKSLIFSLACFLEVTGYQGVSLCKSERPSSLPAGVQQAYLQSFYFKTLSVSKSQTIRNRLLNVFLLSIVLNLISKNRMCSRQPTFLYRVLNSSRCFIFSKFESKGFVTDIVVYHLGILPKSSESPETETCVGGNFWLMQI